MNPMDYMKRLLFFFAIIYTILITAVCNSVDPARDKPALDTTNLQEQVRDKEPESDTAKVMELNRGRQDSIPADFETQKK
jgi:hypothetical protein